MVGHFGTTRREIKGTRLSQRLLVRKNKVDSPQTRSKCLKLDACHAKLEKQKVACRAVAWNDLWIRSAGPPSLLTSYVAAASVCVSL